MTRSTREDDCVVCRAAFPATGVLASLPQAKRVAFDDGGRVWRICTACGAWNLLGPEAAAAARPELLLRTATSPARDDAAGLVLHRLDGIDVVRVTDTAAVPESRAVRRLRWLERWDTWFLIGAALCIPLLAVIVATTGGSDGSAVRHEPRWVGFLRSGIMLSLSYLGVGAWRKRRLRTGNGLFELTLGMLLFLLGAGAGVWGERSWLALGAIVVIVLVNLGLYQVFPFGMPKLPGGRRVLLTGPAVTLTRVRWEPGDRLVVRMPRGRMFEGADADAVLRALLHASGMEGGSVIRPAQRELAEHRDPLAEATGVVRAALAGVTEGVPLGRLSGRELAAIDLLLTERMGVRDELGGLAARAEDAKEIAGEADTLIRRPE